MVKLLIIGLLFSGLVALEAGFCALPYMTSLFPDIGFLLVLVYGMQGRGQILGLLCLVLGLVKGSLTAEPAGFYLLIYFLTGAFLLNTRQFLFIEHPLTQLVVGGLLCLVYASLQWLCGWLGFLPDLGSPVLAGRFYGSVSAACLAPVVIVFYKRATLLRRWLHP